MMGDTATVFHYAVSRSILYILININDLILGELGILQGEVYIDSRSGLVELGNTEGCEDLLLFDTINSTCIINRLSYIFAEWLYL